MASIYILCVSSIGALLVFGPGILQTPEGAFPLYISFVPGYTLAPKNTSEYPRSFSSGILIEFLASVQRGDILLAG